MIRAGMRPQEYADAIRDERARRAAESDPAQQGSEKQAAGESGSAVDIAPRPPSD